jgi:hypothetical protein
LGLPAVGWQSTDEKMVAASGAIFPAEMQIRCVYGVPALAAMTERSAGSDE